jgi:hypothetical protein
MLDLIGKSALVEALMGFQFNHVGGGTKTRRPITLHMKYNAMCAEPRCYLVSEDRPPVEEEKTLEELQVGGNFVIILKQSGEDAVLFYVWN